MTIFNVLKEFFIKKYNIKNLGKVKIIIRWQINRNAAICIIKIDQSAFIKNLVIKKKIINYNANFILIKVGFMIEMKNPKDYKKTKL